MTDEQTKARYYARQYRELGDRAIRGGCLSARDIIVLGWYLVLVRFAKLAGYLLEDECSEPYINQVHVALTAPVKEQQWN